MEMVCYFIGYELEGMSYMICCLCMILMLWKFLIGGWGMYKVWVGHNSKILVVRDLGGASSAGRNSMDPLKGTLSLVCMVVCMVFPLCNDRQFYWYEQMWGPEAVVMAMEMLQLDVHGRVWAYYEALSWRCLLSKFIFL